MKNTGLYHELVATCYGTDEPSIVAWLEQRVEDDKLLGVRRAAIHWDRCGESEKYAIWDALGLGEAHVDRFPYPLMIEQDYRLAVKVASAFLCPND